MEKSHKRLDVWNKSFELAKMIYEVTKKFPSEEKYGLVSQMRRAAVSIPSNIAEGAARQTKKMHYIFLLLREAL
jgi:four helix bundle protein